MIRFFAFYNIHCFLWLCYSSDYKYDIDCDSKDEENKCDLLDSILPKFKDESIPSLYKNRFMISANILHTFNIFNEDVVEIFKRLFSKYAKVTEPKYLISIKFKKTGFPKNLILKSLGIDIFMVLLFKINGVNEPKIKFSEFYNIKIDTYSCIPSHQLIESTLRNSIYSSRCGMHKIYRNETLKIILNAEYIDENFIKNFLTAVEDKIESISSDYSSFRILIISEKSRDIDHEDGDFLKLSLVSGMSYEILYEINKVSDHEKFFLGIKRNYSSFENIKQENEYFLYQILNETHSITNISNGNISNEYRYVKQYNFGKTCLYFSYDLKYMKNNLTIRYVFKLYEMDEHKKYHLYSFEDEVINQFEASYGTFLNEIITNGQNPATVQIFKNQRKILYINEENSFLIRNILNIFSLYGNFILSEDFITKEEFKERIFYYLSDEINKFFEVSNNCNPKYGALINIICNNFHKKYDFVMFEAYEYVFSSEVSFSSFFNKEIPQIMLHKLYRNELSRYKNIKLNKDILEKEIFCSKEIGVLTRLYLSNNSYCYVTIRPIKILYNDDNILEQFIKDTESQINDYFIHLGNKTLELFSNLQCTLNIGSIIFLLKNEFRSFLDGFGEIPTSNQFIEWIKYQTQDLKNTLVYEEKIKRKNVDCGTSELIKKLHIPQIQEIYGILFNCYEKIYPSLKLKKYIYMGFLPRIQSEDEIIMCKEIIESIIYEISPQFDCE